MSWFRSIRAMNSVSFFFEGIERFDILGSAKSGVEANECVDLALHIRDTCKNLNLLGLMTIGSFSEEPTRECFDILSECRSKVAAALGVDAAELELSMGMSHDYELAVS
jgi:uncharacterized pyridoxal phosphate-containing UPF0001 family protein